MNQHTGTKANTATITGTARTARTARGQTFTFRAVVTDGGTGPGRDTLTGSITSSRTTTVTVTVTVTNGNITITTN